MKRYRITITDCGEPETVILFASGTFRVSSWGDIVERNSNRYA